MGSTPSKEAASEEGPRRRMRTPRSESSKPSPSWQMRRTRSDSPNPESPAALSLHEVTRTLTGGVPTFVRPAQPAVPLSPPGGQPVESQDQEHEAWDAVFYADRREHVLQATQQYLRVANITDLLARIADVHAEDDMVTRHRFVRRYLDDTPTDDVDFALPLSRMLIDEIDLPNRMPAEAERSWQDLARVIANIRLAPAWRDRRWQDPYESLQDFLHIHGFARWLCCFRNTHGSRPGYERVIERFFYINPDTGREETYATDDADDMATLASSIMAWTRDPQRALVPSDERAQTAEWDEAFVAQRLTHPEEDDFPEELDNATSLALVDEAVNSTRPGVDDQDFRWGRLYLRVLRHIGTFGVESIMDIYARPVPDPVRLQLAAQDVDEVLRSGRMRTGEASLAALLTDWLGTGTPRQLPGFLQAPRRRLERIEPPADQRLTATPSSRDRLQHRLDHAEARTGRLQGLLAAVEEQLRVERERAEDLEARGVMAEVERDELRERDEHRERDGPTGDRRDGGLRRPSTRQEDSDAETSEDELAGPRAPPRRHGSRSRGSSFDSLYDETPPRSRRPQADSQAPRPKKRKRSTRNDNSGEGAATIPPGRRRRVLVAVVIPRAPAPAPIAPAAPAVAAPATGNTRVTRLKATGTTTFYSMK